uniref:Uncharacterized protein n=1 Tax=Amphimedon queenslandica TaxID=400682 RepID=A0A1X7UXP6_AMPQE
MLLCFTGNDSWKGCDYSAIFSLLDIVLDEYFYHTAGGACIGYDLWLHVYSSDGYVIISMATIMNDNTVHVHVRNQYVHVNGYIALNWAIMSCLCWCSKGSAGVGGTTGAPAVGTTGAPAGGTAGVLPGGTTGAPPEGTPRAIPGGTTGEPPRGTGGTLQGGIARAPPGGIAGAPPGGIAGAPPGGIAGAPPGGIAGSPPGGRMGSSSLLSRSGLGDQLIL